jgi:hypothetical protein
MMSKHLVAHVGFHKTGTTSLQESFAENRDILKAQGVIYPKLGAKAHHRAAWALIGRTWGWKNRGGRTYPISEWKKLVSSINKNRKTTLISSEFFCELSEERIHRFKDDVKADQITIVFTIRPLVKLLRSSYQQYLKYGLTPTYDEWLHSVLDDPGNSKTTPTFWKRHDHGNVISNWAKVFGAQNIVVVVANEREPNAIFGAFNELLQLPSNTLTQPKGISSNRSLTFEEVSLLLEVNKNFPKSRNWSDYEIYIREGAIKHLTDNVPASESDQELLTPAWAVEKARAISELSIGRIKAIGVRVFGDLDTFSTAQVPLGENSPVTSISLTTASQALLAMNEDLLERHSTRLIFKTALKRLKRKIPFI